MKRKLSLVLVLVMLLGCFAGLGAMAEGETEAAPYRPEIAYSNVAYTDGVVLMFAVEAPAALAEGERLELLVWDKLSSVEVFSANDAYVSILSPESAKATINGKEYAVFKYFELDAAMMTDVVYARPLFTDANGNRTYGDVVDYSVVEYVKTARGDFDGFAGLSDDVKSLLSSLLDFGALAQVFLGGDEPYAPNGFLANDTLGEIWVTPVIGGVENTRVFAGFYKHGADGVATVNLPFYDRFETLSVKGADGETLTDLDEDADGMQIAAAAEGDINLVAEYKMLTVGTALLDASDYSAEFNLNSRLGYESIMDEGVSYKKATSIVLKNGYTYNMSATYNHSPSEAATDYVKYPYHGLKVVSDPDNPASQVFQLTATNLSQLSLPSIQYGTNLSSAFGDTIEPVLTITVRLGRVNGKICTVDCLRLRNDQSNVPVIDEAGNPVLDASGKPTVTSSVKTYVPIFDTSASGKVYVGTATSSDSNLVATLPENGMQTFGFAVDFRNETIRAYAEDLQTGEMKLVKEIVLARPDNFNKCNRAERAGYESFESWVTTLKISAQILSTNGNWTSNDKKATVNIDGVDTPIYNTDGSANIPAMQKYCEENKAMLIDDFGILVGDVYGK